MLKTESFIIALLLAALCAVSCQESDLPATSDEAAQWQIGFRAMVEEPATRAIGDGELTTALLKDRGFGVYCWYTGSDDFTTPKSASDRTGSTQPYLMLMRNQKVTWDGTDAAWDYSPVKYWPQDPTEKLTFRAYAPYTDYLLTDATTGMPQLPVMVTKDDYHNGVQHDPLWGTGRSVADAKYGEHYNDVTYATSSHRTTPDATADNTTDGYIHWYFHHGMAKLVFKAKLADEAPDERIKITAIKLEPLYTRGLLDLSSPSTSASDKPIWTDFNGTNEDMKGADALTLTLDTDSPSNSDLYNEFVAKTAGVAEVVDVTKQGLLIIPRTYTAASPLVITVYYQREGDVTIYEAQANLSEIAKNPPQADPRAFYGNTAYTITLNINPVTKNFTITINVNLFWQVGSYKLIDEL
jgi:hypothetical protein